MYELMQLILLVNETLMQCNFSGWGRLPHISNTMNRNSDCWEIKKQRKESTEVQKPYLMNMLRQTRRVFTNAWLQMAELSCAISHIEHDLAATIIPPTCLVHPHLSLTECLFPPLVCPTLAIWLLTMWRYKGWGQGPQQQRSARCLWIRHSGAVRNWQKRNSVHLQAVSWDALKLNSKHSQKYQAGMDIHG